MQQPDFCILYTTCIQSTSCTLLSNIINIQEMVFELWSQDFYYQILSGEVTKRQWHLHYTFSTLYTILPNIINILKGCWSYHNHKVFITKYCHGRTNKHGTLSCDCSMQHNFSTSGILQCIMNMSETEWSYHDYTISIRK